MPFFFSLVWVAFCRAGPTQVKFRNYKPNNEEFKELVLEKPKLETLEQDALTLKNQPVRDTGKEQLVSCGERFFLALFIHLMSLWSVVPGSDESGAKEAKLGS